MKNNLTNYILSAIQCILWVEWKIRLPIMGMCHVNIKGKFNICFSIIVEIENNKAYVYIHEK